MNVYFSHINLKKKVFAAEYRFHFIFWSQMGGAQSYQQLVCTVNCAVHSRNLKNFAQSKFLCISLLLKHAFSRQEFNKIRVDAGQICGIRDKL